METGTEILLARMKEYPEEFINFKDNALAYDSLRWDAVMREGREYLPEEDCKALEAGIKQLYIDRFNERVLKTLAGEDKQEEEKPQGRYGSGWVDPRGGFGGAPVKVEGTQYDYDAHERELKRRIMEQQRMMDEDRKMTERQRMMNYPQKFPLF